MSGSKTPSTIPSISELGPRFFSFVESLERPVVFFDLETTGTDPVHDRIIEVCVLRVCPLPVAIESPRTWRVNPQTKIPREASEIHGIVNEDLEDCPTFAQLAPELRPYFENADLGGFAISRFDVRLLQNEFARCDDPLDLSRARFVDAQVIYHQREPRNLSAAVRYYCDRELEDAHGAQADTIASLAVFAGQLGRYDDLAADVSGLHELSVAQNANYVDGQRRFMWRDDEPVFNFGKLRGKSLRWAATEPSQRDYLRWIARGPFEADVREVVEQALAGKIRRRS